MPFAMNKLFLVFLLLLSSIVSFAQEIHFFDENNNRITKEKFERKQLDSRTKIALSFQKGKITETRLFLRTETGVISQETRNQILSNLEDAMGSEINRSELTIIHYNQGKDRCNSSGSSSASVSQIKEFTARHQEDIKRLGKTSEYRMYATTEGLKDNHGLLERYPDSNLLVERTFFKYKYPCGSFVIIKPDGEYYSYFGEYSWDLVIKQAKKLWK